MKLTPYFALLAVLLLLAGCGSAGTAVPETSEAPDTTEATEGPGYRQVTMEEAIAMMEAESGYILLDVRTPQEFRDRHIPGAINVPNEDIGTGKILELPDKGQLILVYCRSGNRSKQASEKLAALGYTNVVEFGGINDWPGEVVSGE